MQAQSAMIEYNTTVYPLHPAIPRSLFQYLTWHDCGANLRSNKWN
jgi:hypothetical protein